MADDSPEVEKIVVSSLSLGARGKRLFNNMRAQYPNLDPVQLELLVEAARTVDELERLNAIVRGDTDAWMFVRAPRNKAEYVIQIDDVVSQQRQLRLALRTITATLTVAGEVAPPQPQGGVNDIAAAAERRRAAQSGGSAPGKPGTSHSTGS